MSNQTLRDFRVDVGDLTPHERWLIERQQIERGMRIEVAMVIVTVVAAIATFIGIFYTAGQYRTAVQQLEDSRTKAAEDAATADIQRNAAQRNTTFAATMEEFLKACEIVQSVRLPTTGVTLGGHYRTVIVEDEIMTSYEQRSKLKPLDQAITGLTIRMRMNDIWPFDGKWSIEGSLIASFVEEAFTQRHDDNPRKWVIAQAKNLHICAAGPGDLMEWFRTGKNPDSSE